MWTCTTIQLKTNSYKKSVCIVLWSAQKKVRSQPVMSLWIWHNSSIREFIKFSSLLHYKNAQWNRQKYRWKYTTKRTKVNKMAMIPRAWSQRTTPWICRLLVSKISAIWTPEEVTCHLARGLRVGFLILKNQICRPPKLKRLLLRSKKVTLS